MTTTLNNVYILFNQKKYSDAEKLIKQIKNKTASWHYIYGNIMIKKGWFELAKTNLQTATTLAPDNTLFAESYAKFMSRPDHYNGDYDGRRKYRGKRGCDCCDCDCCEISCCDLICLDSLCECFGGDLIECC